MSYDSPPAHMLQPGWMECGPCQSERASHGRVSVWRDCPARMGTVTRTGGARAVPVVISELKASQSHLCRLPSGDAEARDINSCPNVRPALLPFIVSCGCGIAQMSIPKIDEHS